MAVLCFGTLFWRLYLLQIVDADGYAKRASDQQLRDTVLPADRGEIFSSDGTVLATSKTVWTIRASPRELADTLVEPAARAMSEILEIDYDQTLKKFSQRSSNDCLLRRRVEKEMADAVRQWCVANSAEGIEIIQDTKRVYPQGNFMGCLLGFTSVDNAGLGGLELQYDSQLTGQNGRVLSAKNAWGYDMPQHYQTLIDPVQGNSLTLTIDANIQHYLESALSTAVQENNVAARAVGIVMDVNTGAILAMSSQPDYDPNDPRMIVDADTRAQVDSLTGEERTKALQLAQQYQWRNKAISDLYEPGSVFKLITASAALDTGSCTKDTQFVCSGTINVAGTKFHCANGHIHGLETFKQGLGVSCNPCFIQIGARLGKENFCNYFAAFGLREATGIDLPGEIKRSEYYTADKMGPVELASCSFGQSSKVSYLQMITAVSAIVNGGNLMQPYVVSKITAADGTLVKETKPTVKRRVLSEETSATMRELMEYVVTDGTGKNAAIAGYRIAGKSGTSQKLDSEDERARIASFVTVAPADDPRIAVLVCLDEPHSWTTSGGGLSAPVCARVMEQTLPYLGIQPEYSEKEQEKYFSAVPDVNGWRVEAAQQALKEAGFAAKLTGTEERVTSQYPIAGTSLRKGSVVFLDTTGTVDFTAED
jgi:stage V sporulation protein D (sporulation-specific penicillin-binding protein)